MVVDFLAGTGKVGATVAPDLAVFLAAGAWVAFVAAVPDIAFEAVGGLTLVGGAATAFFVVAPANSGEGDGDSDGDGAAACAAGTALAVVAAVGLFAGGLGLAKLTCWAANPRSTA